MSPKLPSYLKRLLEHSSVPPHFGSASLAQSDCASFDDPAADFRALVVGTTTGHCVCAVHADAARFSRNFGSALSISGNYEGRPFEFTAPTVYCEVDPGFPRGPSWIPLKPLNGTATLRYLDGKVAAEVRAHLLNFTSKHSNQRADVLTVVNDGRAFQFVPSASSDDMIRLLRLGAHKSAPLTELRFPIRPGEPEEELDRTAHAVSRFCGLVAQQQTNISHCERVASDGLPTKITFHCVTRSSFRDQYLLPHLHFQTSGLQQLFNESFSTFKTLSSDTKWVRLFNFAQSFLDATFLEQRLATLLAAVELLIRNSLVEAGTLPQAEAERKQFPELLGLARRSLSWFVPPHYTESERYRYLRNAVAHGNSLPHTTRESLDMLQKWSLFLSRRLFIRLGYTGEIASASKGFASLSQVDDFEEDSNSFTRVD